MPDGVTPVALPAGVTLRLVGIDDGPALAAARRRDREHLAPWEPVRPEGFEDVDQHVDRIRDQLDGHRAGRLVPYVLEQDGRIVGSLTVSDVVLGAFCSAHVGYWLASDLTGHGVMTAAVRASAVQARDVLGLHRLQAATLPHNTPSQHVLARAGFEQIGYAPAYLQIAGRWQDHVLFQRILHD
ncbi:GNAT family N-acetyltransferase [Isoptericola jiangsuensis]|uniref:GNAT family N-acetyltransferase n=1 Tax=Isoptericola jiangsuensis TaxID=548579 RepID=UPI003AAA2901